MPNARICKTATRQPTGSICLRKPANNLSRNTRRQCAGVISDVLTEMERARKEQTARIIITRPHVVRAIDGVHVRTQEGKRIVLPIADGAVPYKTSITVAERYDSDAVVDALRGDFARHGAPLVLRLDRAKQHQTRELNELLDEYGVLVLHGPPHYPRFYGQLERQNRELRAWMEAVGLLPDEEFAADIDEARRVLNEVVPRRSLGWKTAAVALQEQQSVVVDRVLLAAEVADEQKRIRLTLTDGPWADDKSRRLAIESVMARHEWLIRQEGGWC